MVTRAPEQTRARILEAAELVLLENGPGNLRVDTVAGIAEVNKRMIYHYFGDKQGLLDAVYAAQVGRLLSKTNALHADTREVLGAFVDQRDSVAETTGIAASPEALCRAARILLPVLVAGGNLAPGAALSARQWRRFAFEMLSLALSDLVRDVLEAQPGSAEFADVSERLLAAKKPRFRMSSASRSRE